MLHQIACVIGNCLRQLPPYSAMNCTCNLDRLLPLTPYQFQGEERHNNSKAGKRASAREMAPKGISPARGWDAPEEASAGRGAVWLVCRLVFFRPAQTTPALLNWQQLFALATVQCQLRRAVARETALHRKRALTANANSKISVVVHAHARTLLRETCCKKNPAAFTSRNNQRQRNPWASSSHSRVKVAYSLTSIASLRC